MDFDLVVGGFVVRGGRLLLVDHKIIKQYVTFGGHVEQGESPSQTLIREAGEEFTDHDIVLG